jgi:hypothetical protein
VVSRQLVDNVVWQKRQRTVLTIIEPQGSPLLTSSDIFVGTDTYGWPPQEGTVDAPIWSPSQRSSLLTLQMLLTAPNIVGLTTAQAFINLAAAGLIGLNAGSAYSNTYPVGIVTLQNPPQGSIVALGSTVSFIVSLGPTPAAICLPPTTAQAGFGGNIWGASGGSATPINASTPLTASMSTGSKPANAIDAVPSLSIMSQASTAALPLSTPVCTVPSSPLVG